MTHLVARLILTMLILPIAGAVFVLGMVVILSMPSSSKGPPQPAHALILWGAVYLVAGFVWIAIWRPVVRWTPRRIGQTVLSGLIALSAGWAFGFTVYVISRHQIPLGIAALLGGGVPPIIWILSTVLVWRETNAERTQRLADGPGGGRPVVCPMCGYDLSGSPEARCPECGAGFTIGRLLAAQPAGAMRSLDDE
ncbi:MAG: hypothetical protein H6813_02910 [Phycisphaeraceae bacterium]|nr:hypothetical protein [Phycisphaeraceae bacterium]MCB9848733.1 hypothetical protein [Phycisphaeraceae bacterium]